MGLVGRKGWICPLEIFRHLHLQCGTIVSLSGQEAAFREEARRRSCKLLVHARDCPP